MATPRSPWAVGAAATAFLLPVAYSPSVHATFWSPKAAILAVAGAIGLARLPLLLRSDLRRPAVAGCAVLAVGLLSTVVSPEPVQATFGAYNWGTGLLFVASLVGLWSLGAAATGGRALVTRWLLAGCAASAAVALVQTLVEVPLPALEDDGRAIGLAGDGTHLGSIAVVGIVLTAWPATARRPWLVAVAGFAATVQVSGTRTALAAAGVAAVAIGLVRARRRTPELVVAVVLGLAAGAVLADAGDITSASSRATSERAFAAASGGGMRVRAEVWWSARHAVLDRPVLGAGPGRFQAATSRYRTSAIVQAEGPGVLYADAHNLLVEHAATTGVLGVLALAWWTVSVLRRAGGALLAVALALLGLSMLQPQSVGTTPLLFLAAGAGTAATLPASTRPARWLAGVAAVAGAVAGLALVAGDEAHHRLYESFDLSHARRADVLLRPWSRPATLIGRVHVFRALGEPDEHRRAALNAEARRWFEEAVRRDPTDPALLRMLASREQLDGLLDDAELHLLAALEHDPFDVFAMQLLAEVELERGDDEAAAGWLERVVAIRPDERVAEQVRRLRS